MDPAERPADNPMVWLVQVDGFIIDIGDAPAEVRRAAFERGLSPDVPADRQAPEACAELAAAHRGRTGQADAAASLVD